MQLALAMIPKTHTYQNKQTSKNANDTWAFWDLRLTTHTNTHGQKES